MSATGTIAATSFTLPLTSSSTVGVITLDGSSFLHAFGAQNTFMGKLAGHFTMTGSDNTAAGVQALLNNTSGTDNTATGLFALGNNTLGNSNTADGSGARSLATPQTAATPPPDLKLLKTTRGAATQPPGMRRSKATLPASRTSPWDFRLAPPT